MIRDVLAYSTSNFVGQFLLFIQGFVLRRFLLPEIMGIWNLVLVVRGYMQPVSLGILSGAARELPILRGRGNKGEESLCRSVTLTSSVAESAVSAGGIWLYALWQRPGGSEIEFYTLVVAGITLVFLRLQEVYTVFFQAAQCYLSLSKALLIVNLTGAIALPLGAAVDGLRGLLFAAVFSEVLRSMWLVRAANRQGLRVTIAWVGSVWKRLSSYGVVYVITNYPISFFAMLDLLWVAKLLGPRALGLYALARTFSNAAADVTVRMGNVLYARILTQVGQGVDQDKIAGDMRRFMLFQLLVSVPLISCLVATVAPFLIRQIIPLYGESIPVLLLLILISFFMSQNSNLFAMWIAGRRLAAFGLSNVVGVLTVGGAIATTWWLLDRRELTDVAIATVVGYVGYFTYMAFSAGTELWGKRMAARIFLEVLASAGWTAGVLFLFGHGVIEMTAWQDDFAQSLHAGLRMALAIAPLAAFGVWRSGGGLYMYKAVKSLRPAKA